MTILLKIIGLINAFYLLSLHATPNKGCLIGETCSEVLSSVYASVWGIPLAGIGVSVFAILLLLDFFYKKDGLNARVYHNVNLLILIPAAAVGIILVMVQWVQLKAFCPFCLMNSLLLLGLFGYAYKNYVSSESFSINLSASQWVALILIGLMPMALSREVNKKSPVNNVIGIVAGDEITMGQLKRSDYNTRFMDLNRKQYQLKKQFVKQKVLEIEATKNQMNVDAYIKNKVINNIVISEKEIKAFYEEKKTEIPKDKTYDDVKRSIKNHLIREKETVVINDHIDTLEGKYGVEIQIPSPDPIVVKQNSFYSYSIGEKNAPIKVVEFADLQCNHCKRAYVTFKKVMEQFKGKIYFEYRHFPLPSHRFSKRFSKGSICAGSQGKFFDYIELTFANQNKLAQITAKELANRLSLNLIEFETCMNGDVAQLALEEDMKEGERIGIQSTPTFIINGQLFIGIPTADDIALFL